MSPDPMKPVPAIPPPLKTFVGRDGELSRLDRALSTGARIVSIEGAGGAGKSALAREYLHRFGAARFPGGRFWIDAEEPLDAQFHAVLQTLRAVPDLPAFHREHRDAGKELAAALEAEAAKAPILWVVDSVPEDGRPLREYCPALGKVAVLATSRHELSALDASVRPLPIGVLDAASAADLLATGLSPWPPRPDCEAVAEWVGRLPLALAVLNGTLRLGRLTLEQLVATARRQQDPSSAVEQAFGLSFDLLSRAAQEAVRLIARLAPSAVPMGLIPHLGLWVDVRGELVETGFVSELAPATLGTMHPGLADYVRSRSTDELAEVMRAVAGVTAMLSEASHAREPWRVLLHCVPHARHLLRVTHPRKGTVQVPLLLRAVLADTLSKALMDLGPKQDALEILQDAVEAFRPLQKMAGSAFEPDLAAALDNLSACLGELGRKEEAAAAVREAAEIRARLEQKRA